MPVRNHQRAFKPVPIKTAACQVSETLMESAEGFYCHATHVFPRKK